MTDTGLLFVYGECGPNVTEEEFNDWYDNEHGPLRLTVPGFRNAIRYKATDGRAPSWLAIYDLESPATGTSEAYKALASKASDREKALIPRLADLNRSIFEHIATTTGPTATPSSYPGKFVIVVSVSVDDALEDEYNKWFDEEHSVAQAKVPGFLRLRRYKLLSNMQLAGKRLSEGPIHNYLTIYEADRDGINQLTEWQEGIKTPWSLKIMPQFKALQLRRFELHKNIARPE